MSFFVSLISFSCLITQVTFVLISLFLRSTEHDHVKDNLPAKLLRIRTFGKMKLDDFKDLISVADYKTCETKMEKNPTWYPLTLDVFVKFLYKVFFFLSLLHSFPLFPCLYTVLIPLFHREKSQMQPILQQGFIVTILPRTVGRLWKFGRL